MEGHTARGWVVVVSEGCGASGAAEAVERCRNVVRVHLSGGVGSKARAAVRRGEGGCLRRKRCEGSYDSFTACWYIPYPSRGCTTSIARRAGFRSRCLGLCLIYYDCHPLFGTLPVLRVWRAFEEVLCLPLAIIMHPNAHLN